MSSMKVEHDPNYDVGEIELAPLLLQTSHVDVHTALDGDIHSQSILDSDDPDWNSNPTIERQLYRVRMEAEVSTPGSHSCETTFDIGDISFTPRKLHC